MIFKFNNTILVAPLDWGLGHTTRCIPIIKHLQIIGCKVIVAAEGAQQALLQSEFPALQFLPLKGYQINYTTDKRFFLLKILRQLPKIYRAIKNENRWLKTIIKQHEIDAVISDNRYGLYTSESTCVFITHQLAIKAPFALAEKLIRNINYYFINKFSACWVPDEQGVVNLAGVLSHPVSFPSIPVNYLGVLSRFQLRQAPLYKYKFLVVLSGPEPQRTAFENKMLGELQTFKGKALLVRGLPGDTNKLADINDVTIKNHLTSSDMENAFNESEYIISRSGYTTVMDICKLRKKAIFIPTPGQTEQEYLAKHLNKKGWCINVDQNNIRLQEVLQKANAFPFTFPDLSIDGYKKVVEDFVSSIPSH